MKNKVLGLIFSVGLFLVGGIFADEASEPKGPKVEGKTVLVKRAYDSVISFFGGKYAKVRDYTLTTWNNNTYYIRPVTWTAGIRSDIVHER